MKITNAIKKLEKAGFEVTNDGSRFSARRASNIVEFIKMEETQIKPSAFASSA
jgi:hypothetical protein